MATTNLGTRLPWLGGPVLALLVAIAPVSAASAWTDPVAIGPLRDCSGAAMALDEAGGVHIAALCSNAIRYAELVDGRWSSRTFALLADEFDSGPRIAIDSGRIYVAYSREDRSTCGTGYLGVYYRWRSVADGKWSPARQLGERGDGLQSFRVAGGTVHATVINERKGNLLIYERQSNGILKRYTLSDHVIGQSSLRVSNAGTARIVFQNGRSVRYARFNGAGFDVTSIPGTNSFDRDPVLVLDAQDHAHVAWIHTDGQSCGDDGVDVVGTYYATDQAGGWTPTGARRITGDLGSLSMTIDTTTRRVHLLLAGDSGVKYYTKTPVGAWRGLRLSSTGWGQGTIRLEQATGRLFVVYRDGSDDMVYQTKP